MWLGDAFADKWTHNIKSTYKLYWTIALKIEAC